MQNFPKGKPSQNVHSLQYISTNQNTINKAKSCPILIEMIVKKEYTYWISLKHETPSPHIRNYIKRKKVAIIEAHT